VKLLLDTHAFLWWIGDDARLSGPAREAIADPGNDVSFSVASAWELAIKTAIGRFEADGGLRPFLDEHIQRNAFRVLPVKLEHAVSVASLPAHHRDPFDRLLVAQAATEGLILVTRDPQLAKYGTPILW
jgi:PIN domain nuclease of toxin-antitoxin system